MSEANVRPMQRVGIVANPHAGRSPETVSAAVRALLDRLKNREIVCASGTVIDRIAEELAVPHHSIPSQGASPDRPIKVLAMTTSLLQAGVDLIIGIGGDGTLCDIAAAILAAEAPVPLFGIGVGSSNVGPLVSVAVEDIRRIEWADLASVNVHGLEAQASGLGLGVAFNDVVFGNTYFATQDGVRVDIDAAASLRGIDQPATPQSVCGPETWIAKNGNRLLVGSKVAIGQIIASPLNQVGSCAGKVVSGLLSWGPYVGMHAVIAAASAVMVRTKLERHDVEAVEPLCLHHIGIGPQDVIEVGGLRPEAVMIIDGNPVHIMEPEETITLRVRKDAIGVLRHRSAEQRLG